MFGNIGDLTGNVISSKKNLPLLLAILSMVLGLVWGEPICIEDLDHLAVQGHRNRHLATHA